MRKVMRAVMMLLAIVLLVSFSAAAQDFPKFEVFGGYTYARVDSSEGTTANTNGGSVDAGFFPTTHLGVIADFGGSYDKGFTHTGNFFSAPSTNFRYLFGPRYRVGRGPISAYAQVLFGGESRSHVVDSNRADSNFLPCGSCSIPPTFTFASAQTTYAIAPSVGVDVKVNRHFSIRAIQIGGLVTGFRDFGTGANATQGGVTISTGIVAKF
jgi:hypothetical protein